MTKKLCIITGANSGIGKQAAIQIAAQGYQVIIGCRNKERGEVALNEIKEISKSGNVELILLDMSLKSSILSFSNTIKEKYDKADVLIHNAAVFDIAQKSSIVTSEGYETIWMTNHISPVYLTDLLLDLLRKSDDPRILTVSSKGLLAMPMLKVDLVDPEFKTGKFAVNKAYYQSKLAQVMYTYWLARELKADGISVNAIRVPAVQVDISRHPGISPFMKWVYQQKSKKSITPSRMAETYTFLATNPGIKGVSGKYFDENNQEVKSNKYTSNWDNINDVIKLTKKYL
ncbi:MAG: dehydrogenase [Chloroflexi bacterium HGW-Chloroflexi-10]|nr:MAG: dehydrogenase [Chloroflexi bacterium HGW-Chloroflexi-10]